MRIAVPLILALLFRYALVFSHVFIEPLHGGLHDAETFERLAADWAAIGLDHVLEHYRGPNSHFYAVKAGVVYAIAGREVVVLMSLSVLAAMLTLVYGYKLTREIWGAEIARLSFWVMALFPLHMLYSIHHRREVFIYLFFVLTMYFVARFSNTSRPYYLAFAGISAFAGIFYHTGMLFLILSISILILFRVVKSATFRGKINPLFAIAGLIFFIGAVGFVASGGALSGIGDWRRWTDADMIVGMAEGRAHGGAAYPSWLLPSRDVDLIWNVPVRAIYLLFAPFPWDVRSSVHLIGLADGLLFMLVAFALWRSRKLIAANQCAKDVFYVMLPFLLVFGMSVANFGNGMRHRQKFIIILIALAAPYIARFVSRLIRGINRTT